jgi:hypothetical protein
MKEEKKKIIGNIASVMLLIGVFLLIAPLLIIAFEAHLLIGLTLLGGVLAIASIITMDILQG